MAIAAISIAGYDCSSLSFVSGVAFAAVVAGEDDSKFAAGTENDVAVKVLRGNVMDTASAGHFCGDCECDHDVAPIRISGSAGAVAINLDCMDTVYVFKNVYQANKLPFVGFKTRGL
jgi:hypothetical protein